MKKFFNSLSNEDKLAFNGSLLYSEPENIVQRFNIDDVVYCEVFYENEDDINKRITFRLAVDKKHRKQYFATQMIKNVIDFCFSSLAVKEIYIDIKKKNKIAIKILKKFNFQKDCYLGNQYERYVLRKDF